MPWSPNTYSDSESEDEEVEEDEDDKEDRAEEEQSEDDEQDKESEEDNDATLFDTMQSSFEKRTEKLGHDYAIVAWICWCCVPP